MVSTKSEVIVRTRFAPSPTGCLHIGGARTAFFNYILAKQSEGKFILRIEDTDLERSGMEFAQDQYQDLCWLGIVPDESPYQFGELGPYKQTQRLDIYQEYTTFLLEKKKAYHCFCSTDELKDEKDNFLKKTKNGNYQYSRKCLNLDAGIIKKNLKEKKECVIRLRIDREKEYEFNDLVRGKILFHGRDIEDCILIRSNAMPLLNLAVVIDDRLMKITHVLRGEEHLSNTAKQLVLYDAFGWNYPFFAHISVIFNKEGKKLSKRSLNDETPSIGRLRELGYLPEAVRNYLLLLGWHPGDGVTKEFFSLEESIEMFSLKGLQVSGAIFDLNKLNWFNHHYIRKLSNLDFNNYAINFLKKGYNLAEKQDSWIHDLIALFRSQINFFYEIIDLSSFFFVDFPEKEFVLIESQILAISSLVIILERIVDWNIEAINNAFQKVIDDFVNLPNKKEFYLVLRESLTGRDKGPKMISVIFLLGKELVIKRLRQFRR